MKFYLILISMILGQASAQSEHELVRKTLLNYINGSSYNKSDLIEKAFYPEAPLFLSKEGQEIFRVTPKEYSSWYTKKSYGSYNGRIGNILSLNIENNIASAKAEIIMENSKRSFIDMFLLKKLSGEWKIISKSATESTMKTGKKILFIVSNASYHGKSKLKAGASFSELVHAYHTFTKAGYSVHFLSPQGGSIPVVYIDTSDELIKSYLYNEDFMQGLKYTKSPDQVDPKEYAAVHYIGGSSAMYGVADNTAIQKISMDVYEENNGIISSVCHGSIGIVNLKTKDGEYLVSGKRVSGYPDIFEKQDQAYFKEFPQLITKTIEDHGGIFSYSPRNNAHVEVDGRLITGQNYLSSSLVAEKIIELIEK